MTPSAIAGYITKKEVEERYGRSHRSLTRDFSTAVRRSDQKVLAHLKLQTDNGTVRTGTEVSLEKIQEWSNQGLSPTWYVEENWAAQRYGVRSVPFPDRDTEKLNHIPPRTEAETVDRADLADLIRRLDEQIQDLRQELKIKNEQIQQANERTRESNVLMRELQTLLGDVQKRALLSQPAERASKTMPKPSEGDIAVEQKSHRLTPARPSKPVPSKARPRSEKSTTRQKAKPTSAKPTPAVPRSNPKWYELPTFNKLLRRRP